MIAMTVASILLVGVTAAYSALGRASGRLVLAQTGMTQRAAVRCRPDEATRPQPPSRFRCPLPERCEYDTVSQSCRSTISPST